jgi:hypothetical protein
MKTFPFVNIYRVEEIGAEPAAPQRIAADQPNAGPVTSSRPRFMEPKFQQPMAGREMLLLTVGGVAVRGSWRDNAGFTHWSPMPKVARHEDWVFVCSCTNEDAPSARSRVFAVRSALTTKGKDVYTEFEAWLDAEHREEWLQVECAFRGVLESA